MSASLIALSQIRLQFQSHHQHTFLYFSKHPKAKSFLRSWGKVMEHSRSAPPSWPTTVKNFSCSSGVQRNRVLAAAAATAAPEDNPGLSGYCLPAEPVEKGLADLRIPAEMLPLSVQTYDPSSLFMERHKRAKHWARIEEHAYPPKTLSHMHTLYSLTPYWHFRKENSFSRAKQTWRLLICWWASQLDWCGG